MRYGQVNGIAQHLELKRANRHGLIAGATGTGKTVTLQTFAERFAREGVPVFCADIKGDLEGIASDNPTVFWDVFGELGHPVRTTVENMGSMLMSRMMQLTPVQEGVVAVAFKYASDNGIALDTLADFRALLGELIKNAKQISVTYGNVTAGSVGAIMRNLTLLESEGGDHFFGSPGLDIEDFMRVTDGVGQINLLNAVKLVNNPRLYSAFLLWLLTEFYRKLPEVGDLEKPKFVFFFDEAHLLFNDGSKVLIETVERTVRLIRSKGVGVYFVTQGPADIPETILAQLSNRVQHALRAFTAQAQRSVTAAAKTMPKNPNIDIADAITKLKVGRALTTMLLRDGTPSITEEVQIDLPESQLGPLDPEFRKLLVAQSPIAGKYEKRATVVRRNNESSTAAKIIVGGIVTTGALMPLVPLGMLIAGIVWLISKAG